jgi:group I intron endonuclease
MFTLYIVLNKKNNKTYAGLTSRTLKDRWREHVNDAKHNKGYRLHQAIRKYGKASFKIIPIIKTIDQQLANEFEKMYICLLDSYNPKSGYNSTFGGIGVVPIEIVREKMRAANQGENNPNFGKLMSEETKRKISLANTGKKRTVLQRKNMSRGLTGLIRSAEHSKKIGDAHRGKPTHMIVTEWHKERIRIANCDRKHSEDAKQKMSVAKLGTQWSIIRRQKFEEKGVKNI